MRIQLRSLRVSWCLCLVTLIVMACTQRSAPHRRPVATEASSKVKPAPDAQAGSVPSTKAPARDCGPVPPGAPLAPDELFTYQAPSPVIISEPGRSPYLGNQLLVFLKEGTDRQSLIEGIKPYCGWLVGQIPDLSMYQILVPAPTREELQELMMEMEKLPFVENVLFNFLIEVN